MIVVKCTDLDRKALEGISIKPEEIEDDGFDWHEVLVKKPWGHEIERYRDERVSVWLLYLETGKETSMHCHPSKTTLLMVIRGNVILSTLKETQHLAEGDCVVVEKGAFHRSSSVGGAVMYELESPPNKRDLVRLHDSYGRGQGYEKVCVNSTP